MTGKYFYSQSETCFTLILDRGKEYKGARYATIRVRDKSCMIYEAESEMSALRLLPANSNPCAPQPFKEALAAFVTKSDIIMKMEVSSKTADQTNMERVLRFVNSQHLERLRAEFLEVEDYVNAILVRDEINRRIDAGYMERQSDGLAIPVDLPWTPSQE
jgi:hypothetical protein